MNKTRPFAAEMCGSLKFRVLVSPRILTKYDTIRYDTVSQPGQWSPYYVKDKESLERIQHRFTRMVPGLQSLPYEERLDRLGIWTYERRNRADLLHYNTRDGHLLNLVTFYRAMHFSAKARYCHRMSSVCQSVRLSVCNVGGL